MNGEKQIHVLKSNGERVPYDREKIITAFTSVGIDTEQSTQIILQIEPKLYDGIPTIKIYQLVYSILKRKKSFRAAGRYRLKKAIFDLGPSGYPFEIFVGRLFESFGFSVQVGQFIQGKCVQHEVDVVASRPGEKVIIETKFRVDFKGKTTVQVPLYINSRFNDIRARWNEDDKYKDLNIRGYVVTNARFTADAIKYAECVGLGLISWDYPEGGSLKHFIDQSGLHPLTSLHKLRKTDQKFLLQEGLVLCRELINNQDILRKHGIAEARISQILEEAEMLISS